MGGNTQVNNKSMKIYDVCHDRDYISKLPEDILSDILSRLPTKEIFRTCILSKDWKDKWTCTNTVDFNDGSWETCFVDTRGFVNFVDMILPSCKHLKSFRLVCGIQFEIGIVHRWIFIALMHKLESLTVKSPFRGIIYPSRVLNSTSLRQLDLRYNTVSVASKNIAANLTSLYLAHLSIGVENSNTGTVTFTFPVLEKCMFRQCRWLNVNTVEIYAPSLTTFQSSPDFPNEDYSYSYALITPRLSTFASLFSFPEEFSVNGLSVVSASICGGVDGMVDSFSILAKIGLRVTNLLNKFTNLEELEISSYIAEVSRLGPPLQCHYKLRRLTLTCKWSIELLFCMLHAAPSLKILNMSRLSDFDDGKIETVPSCIISQLEEVEFDGNYIWNGSQYKFAKFLLEKAERLKKISLIGFNDKQSLAVKSEVMETLSGFPRHSPSLIIE